jgi:cytochrome c2
VNAVGPSLWGIVGRDIASAEGYAYSGSLSDIEGDWTLETLQAFLESPKGMAADTKMSFKGLSKVEDRVNLIVYLNEADGSPVELAAAAGGEAEAPAPEAVTEAVTETAAEPATEASTETATAESTEAAQPAEAAGSGFGDLLATADAEAGKKIFRKCRGCHKVEEGKNGIGPSLWGVIGRDVASIEGFAYSDAMLGKAGNWTGADLFAYLEDPKGVVPGTKMKFAGVKDPQDRANVITFLNEADGSPEPLQ